MRRAGRAVALALLVVLLSACGASEEEAMDDLEVLADDLMARGSEVVEVLEAAGLEVALARGKGDYCQMVPVQGLTFAFGGALTEDVAYAERFRVARDAMVDQGWEVVVEGEYARRGERPHPYVELEREDH